MPLREKILACGGVVLSTLAYQNVRPGYAMDIANSLVNSELDKLAQESEHYWSLSQ